MNWDKIEKIATEIRNEMGGDAMEICNGGSARYDCTDFAKTMVDRLKTEGIESVIVDNLEGAAMKSDLEGYETVDAEYENGISHCYVKIEDEIEDRYYDAFDPQGVEKEHELEYHEACEEA